MNNTDIPVGTGAPEPEGTGKTTKQLAKKAKKLARALEAARNAKLYWTVREQRDQEGGKP